MGVMDEKQLVVRMWSNPLLLFQLMQLQMHYCFIRAACSLKNIRTEHSSRFMDHGIVRPKNRKDIMWRLYHLKMVNQLAPWEIFADGFAGVETVMSPKQAQHRPCGLAQGPDGALYVSDDVKGTIYKIVYKN